MGKKAITIGAGACGCCCGCCGLVSIIVGWAALAPLIQAIYDLTEDVMYIDDPSDGTENPVAESKQYEDWSERDDGTSWVYSAFSTTNPAAVIGGARPAVTEMGPIATVQFTSRIVTTADKADWASTGVARFKTVTMNYLDNTTCNADCLALLDTTITVPNAVWARMVSNAVDVPLIILYFVGGIGQAAAASGTSPQAIPGVVVGQLMQATTTSPGVDAQQTEAAALASVCLSTSTTMLQKLAQLGLFLQGALSGQGCTLGTTQITAARCAALLANLQGKVGPTFSNLMTLHATAYGTGVGAPVFMNVLVRNVLAYGTSNTGVAFADPLTSLTINLPAALNYDFPTNFKIQQMGSRFGEMGTAVYVGYNDGTTDCRVDRDCCPGGQCDLLTSPGACAATTLPDNCNPLVYNHRSVGAIPGECFGEDCGFRNFGVGTTYPMLVNGVGIEVIIASEGEEDVGDGKKLKYKEVHMNKVLRRLENCDGTGGADSPGFDCDGPWGTYNYGPIQGAPLYVGMPMFASSLLDDYTGMNAGQPQTMGYDPTTRIEMTYCTGNSWCDENRPNKYRAILKIEPETGKTYFGSISVLVTCRITASSVHTSIADAAVPIFLYQSTNQATDDTKQKLADLQGAPAFLGMLVLLLTILGIIFLLFGCCGCGFAAFQAMKKDADREVNL